MARPRRRPKKPAALRCFLGLAFPLAPQLSPLIDHLGRLAVDPDTKLRLVDPGNMHITLKFLGDIDKARLREVAVQARFVCRQHHEMELHCLGLGFFRNLIWVGIAADPSLGALADKLNQAVARFGVAMENKPFTPHVTVARFARGAKVKLSELQNEFSERSWGSFTAGQVRLYRSDTLPEGARYTILETFDLDGRAP